MIFLVLSVICSVSIAHLFKYVEGQSLPTFGLLATNYAVASLVALGGSYQEESAFLRPIPFWLLGIVVGVLFVGSYVLMIVTIHKLGVTIPVSLMRLSAVLPTVGSIIFFAEFPQKFQVIGILLAFLSLPLTSEERLVFTNLTRILDNGFGWGLLLFVVFGIANFVFKIQRELFPMGNPFVFLAFIFPTAFLVAASLALRQKARMTKPVAAFGMVIGLLNLGANYSLIRALQDLPGIVVYPINGVGIILLSAITSLILWKERLTRSNYAFIVLAAAALLLVYQR